MKSLDMPSFGADMETGIVRQWCVKPGDIIKKGDVVAVIETAKGLIDMEAFEDCTLLRYLVPLDENVKVGQPIMQLVEEAAAPESSTTDDFSTPAQLTTEHRDTGTTGLAESQSSVSVSGSQRGIIASPAAKRLAAQKHIDLTQLTGTGVMGAVCLKDVEKAFSSCSTQAQSSEPKLLQSELAQPELAQPEPAPVEKTGHDHPTGFKSDSMREAIASVVSQSKRTIPHYYLNSDIDLTATEQWLDEINSARTAEDRLLINVPIMCAISRALRKHSDFNGFYRANHFSPAAFVHLGLAIRLRNKGLVTPAIHHADELDAFDMMAKLKSVVERAKLGGLKQSELQDGTATLSNIGDRGSDQIFGVIFPPQVTIIGVGRVARKARVIDGNIEARTVVNVSLAADHRVTDGYMGARFLNEVSHQLQRPAKFSGGKQ